MAKPTIILVPGAWNRASAYSGLIKPLEAAGYKVIAIDIPSVVAPGDEPTEGWTDDVALIQKSIKAEADAGNDVAILVHSYGGVPGAQAVEGYEKNVVRLVYLCAFVVDVGGSLYGMLGGQWLPWMKEKGKYMYAEDNESIFYNDVSDSVAQENKKTLLLHSPGSMKQAVTYAGFKHVPSTYIVCEQDAAIPEPIQRQMASQDGKWAMEPLVIDASHVPFLNKPDETVQAVIKAIS